MPNVKTVKLTGGEVAVSFDSSCPFVIITNMGDSEIYASNSSGITPYADGVYTVMAGVEICITTKSSCNTIYLLGSGAVQVRAEETAVPVSFKPSAKGGDTAIDIDLTDYVKNTTNSEIMTKYGVSVALSVTIDHAFFTAESKVICPVSAAAANSVSVKLPASAACATAAAPASIFSSARFTVAN